MSKKKIGIITIHRIFNYGSVLQAYALQNVCESLGFDVEIIDYVYPNSSHRSTSSNKQLNSYEETATEKIYKYLFKILYSFPLLKQHKSIVRFRNNYLNLSSVAYSTPDEIKKNISHYDIYVTGSDQIWNPRYTGGDGTFFFDFLKGVKKVAYSSSFGVSSIPVEFKEKYASFLSDFSAISVREKNGVEIVRQLTGKNAELVLDPTLLLKKENWDTISVHPLGKKKYILCYFLNYTFNGFPYLDDLAEYISEKTGYTLLHIARPPQKIVNRKSIFKVATSPEEFIGLISNAELVITTSFHGVAFALNYNKPIYAVAQSRTALDSRLVDLMKSAGLENRILYKNETFPNEKDFFVVSPTAETKLNELREKSIEYLSKALSD